ncbi:Protein-export membrane protein SecF [uncultured archaeon]|nr:Protein-export membrane protein SecF [uncultured archaeon]
MKLELPNIYHSKNLKFLVVLPLVLMLLGLYFSTQIVYDTSLRGGVTVLLQTNSTASTSDLASQIGTGLHSEAPSISKSPGGLQVTLSMNQSVADAETYLVDFYSYKANYTSYFFNATSASLALQRDQGNSTLLLELHKSNAGVNTSILGMRTYFLKEMDALAPFGVQYSAVNLSDAAQMLPAAQGAYTNASNKYKDHVIDVLTSIVPSTSYSYEQVTPTLGKFFLQELQTTIIVAFVLIFIAVFFVFRSVVPSAIVVFGAANDMIVALGAMAIFKIPLGVASIAGLLMLIGYSIDTDMLTAIRILKRGEGTAESRAYGSMKTGVTMTATAIVSFGALFAISMIEYVPTYYQIAGVVLMGLIGDVITTWFGNAALILMYKERKEKR